MLTKPLVKIQESLWCSYFQVTQHWVRVQWGLWVRVRVRVRKYKHSRPSWVTLSRWGTRVYRPTVLYITAEIRSEGLWFCLQITIACTRPMCFTPSGTWLLSRFPAFRKFHSTMTTSPVCTDLHLSSKHFSAPSCCLAKKTVSGGIFFYLLFCDIPCNIAQQLITRNLS